MEFLPRLSCKRRYGGVKPSRFTRGSVVTSTLAARPGARRQPRSLRDALFLLFFMTKLYRAPARRGVGWEVIIISCFPIFRAEPSWGSFKGSRLRLSRSPPCAVPLPRRPPLLHVLRGLNGDSAGSKVKRPSPELSWRHWGLSKQEILGSLLPFPSVLAGGAKRGGKGFAGLGWGFFVVLWGFCLVFLLLLLLRCWWKDVKGLKCPVCPLPWSLGER